MKRHRRLWTATGLACSRHPADRFLSFHFVEIHRLHKSTHTAIRGKKQVYRSTEPAILKWERTERLWSYRILETPLDFILRPNDTCIAVISVKIVAMNNFMLISAGSLSIPNLEWMTGMLAKIKIIQNGENGNSTGVGHTPLTSDILPE